MAEDNETFSRDLIEQLLAKAADIARRRVGRVSTTLAQAMTLEVDSPAQGRLHIPHYWAVYVNDGKTSNALLVWFADPADDPRLSGSGAYAVRRSEVKRLTPDQWKEWRIKNREAIKSGKIVIAFSRKPRKAKKFFDNDGGMSAFHDAANTAGSKAFRRHVKDFMGDLLKTKATTRIKLPRLG